MRPVILSVAFALLFAGDRIAAAPPEPSPDVLKLRDGDRVVLLGGTLIEREQRHGYWETALTRRHPGKNITFRNLGWSGDTVFGEARAGFGTPADGFKHLQEHVLALKPTLIVVCYGMNESFDGPAGLPRFRQGLNTLLDTLAPTGARIALLTPNAHEDLGRPLPDPAAHNLNLKLYAQALRETAAQRKLGFLNLLAYRDIEDSAETAPLTDNGLHFTAYGYWRTADILHVFHGPAWWRVEVDGEGSVNQRENTQVVVRQASPPHFQVTARFLPEPPPPKDAPAEAARLREIRRLRVRGLPPGRHQLRIDGKPVVTAPAAQWERGVSIPSGPEFDEVEQLRQAIVEKNQLYFHRWRPQNETYLFGFRKYEQGQNAREVPQFDPLVAALEAKIRKLSVPVPHTYEVVPVK